MKELETSFQRKEVMNIPFAEMNAEQLIRHILLHHHFYVKQSMPVIEEHLTKVATKHGEHFPYMKNVLQLFTHLKNEMYLLIEIFFPHHYPLSSRANVPGISKVLPMRTARRSQQCLPISLQMKNFSVMSQDYCRSGTPWIQIWKLIVLLCNLKL